MQKLFIAGSALVIIALAMNLYTGIAVFVIAALIVAALIIILALLSSRKKANSADEGGDYDDLGECNYEYQQLEENCSRLEEKVDSLEKQLAEKTEDLLTHKLQCRKITEASGAERTLSQVIIDKTEKATLELTNHVYNIGDWSRDVDSLIQRVFGQLTSDQGGLRVQSIRLEEELERIKQLVQDFEGIHTGYISELEKVEKTMKSVDEFTDIITDLSERTNVLAINASIEAARAGQAGRGFAVIASEVQELAKNTMQIADEISTTIDSSVHAVKDSISAYGDRLHAAVERLAHSGEQHAAVIAQLRPQIDKVSEVIEESQKLSASVTDNINGVTVHLQYQDSVRQILEHMVQLFENLAGESAKLIEQHGGLSSEEIQAQQQEIDALLKSLFTTREEWQAFGHQLDEKLTEDELKERQKAEEAELSGDITLF